MIDLSQVVRRQRLPIELVFEIAANMIVGRHNVAGRERAHCAVVKAEHLIPLRRLHWRSPRALTGTTVERVPPIAASTAWAVRPIELVVMLLPVQSRSSRRGRIGDTAPVSVLDQLSKLARSPGTPPWRSRR